MTKIFLALVSVWYFLAAPDLAFADFTAQLKIISSSQTLAPGATSSVITLELQDLAGSRINATSTLRANLNSTSPNGQFTSSPASGPCGAVINPASVTVATGTSRKSFCYVDLSEGTFTITAQPDLPEISGATYEVTIASVTPPPAGGPTPTPTPTPTGEPTPTPTPPALAPVSDELSTSTLVKIQRFMPNPAGEDSGYEWVEIKNSDSKTVNLEGWFLDDSNTTSTPGTGAYILSGKIVAGETLRIEVPSGHFAFNNSGGDEVNLYFPDMSLADKAIYTAAALDDDIFEFRDGQWQPPAKPVATTGGSSGGGGSYTTNYSTTPAAALKLNEIFPNALSEDSGFEWVEIFNPGLATTTLEGYFLADGAQDTWSSSTSWAIPKNFFVPPMGVVAITLPAGSLNLNNSGQEKIKLFSPQKQLLDFVEYEDAPENRSWAKDQTGKWKWAIPTFNLVNSLEPGVWQIIFSEILPQVSEGEEFVELYNNSTSTINLEGAVLEVGSRKKIFTAGDTIVPKSFFVIYEDDLPARLNNSGQTLKFLDAFGRLVSELTYPKALAGHSYANLNNQTFEWTQNSTPGEENKFVLSAYMDLGGLEEEVSTTKTTPALTRAQASSLISSNRELKAQIQALEQSMQALRQQLNLKAAPVLAAESQSLPDSLETMPEESSPSSFPSVFIMALIAAALVATFTLKFLGKT